MAVRLNYDTGGEPLRPDEREEGTGWPSSIILSALMQDLTKEFFGSVTLGIMEKLFRRVLLDYLT